MKMWVFALTCGGLCGIVGWLALHFARHLEGIGWTWNYARIYS